MTQDSLSPEDARRAAKNVGMLAFASIFSKGLLFGWQIILTQGLGVAVYGVYGAVSSFIQVAAILPNFGISSILVRDVARRPDQTGRYWMTALVVQTSLAVLAYIGVNAAAALGGYSFAVRTFLALAAINLIVDILGNQGHDLLLAHERMRATAIVAFGHVTLLLVLGGGALALGYGLPGVYIGTIIAGVLRAGALAGLLLSEGFRPLWPFDRQLAWTLLLSSAPLALAAFLNLAYQQADKLLTNRFIGDIETAYLSAAFLVIFGLTEVLNTTVFTATYPLLSRAFGDGKNPLFGSLISRLILLDSLITLPVVLLIGLFAVPLTALLGPNYAPTASVLQILIWYALVNIVTSSLNYAFIIQNRQRRLMVIRAIGLCINIGLLLVFLPLWGVSGAAVALTLSELLVLMMMLRGFDAAGWETRALLKQWGRLALLGGVTAAVMLVLGRIHPIVGMVGGGLAYLVCIKPLGVLSASDWDLLRQLLVIVPGGKRLLALFTPNASAR